MTPQTPSRAGSLDVDRRTPSQGSRVDGSAAGLATTAASDTFPHRGWTLTGLGRAVLAADERLCASDLFSPEQYDAIRNAGLDVWFVRADSLLGLS